MASILDALKNAGKAAQNIPYVTSLPKTTQNTARRTSGTSGNKVGTNGGGAPSFIDTIGRPEITDKPVNGSGYNGGGGGGSGAGSYYKNSSVPSMYDQYVRAIDEQNRLLQQQQESMRKQRESQMQATIDANNQAADRSLQEAYIANMMSKKNLPQQLKAAGISGGATETTLADMQNTYMNNRNNIDINRQNANAQARRAYDDGVNGDYSDYLAKAYELQGGLADAIASGSLSGKTTTSGGASGYTTDAVSGSTPTGDTEKTYSISKLGITANSLPDLYQQMINMGMTEAQVDKYFRDTGLVASYGAGER